MFIDSGWFYSVLNWPADNKQTNLILDAET